MNAPTPGYPPPAPWYDAGHYPSRALYIVLTVILVSVTVGLVAAMVAAFFPGTPGRWPMMEAVPWDAFVGFVILMVILFVVLGVVRSALWGLWWAPRARVYYRHAHRFGFAPGGPFDPDPAVRIARERLARGEITSDQFEKLLRDLRSGDGGRLP